ncbi:hypothetical protein ABZ461_39100 [Actinacidiphila glaucinigra]|uniref:hypothetical protein n=1 Tax=Actinacidiphila glaucinigra TaxID=235986 RepID=UPI0033CCAF42
MTMLATVAPEDRWFVGLRFSTARGAVRSHYYVVGEADDAEDAVRAAMHRAADAHECAARENAEIDGVEVRRLRWNPLGWAYLTAADGDAGASLCLGPDAGTAGSA